MLMEKKKACNVPILKYFRLDFGLALQSQFPSLYHAAVGCEIIVNYLTSNNCLKRQFQLRVTAKAHTIFSNGFGLDSSPQFSTPDLSSLRDKTCHLPSSTE